MQFNPTVKWKNKAVLLLTILVVAVSLVFSLGGCGTQAKTAPATPSPAQISPAHTAKAPSPSSGTPQERGQAALLSRKNGASSPSHPESAGLAAWVVGDDGTLLHTSDGGQTWLPVSLPGGWTPETVSFPDALHGWAVVNRRSPSPAAALFATADGGRNWSLKSTSFKNLVDVYFLNSSDGWASTADSLHITTDGGTNWRRGDTIGLAVTTDGGQTWVRQPSGTTAILREVVVPGS